MADLGELDVLIIGGGMGGCIVATDQSAPEFGREHKEFMRDVYILQRPHRVRAEYLKRGSIGISLVRPSGVLGKMDAYLDLEYDRTDPGTLRRLREGHEIGLEILKKWEPGKFPSPRMGCASPMSVGSAAAAGQEVIGVIQW